MDGKEVVGVADGSLDGREEGLVEGCDDGMEEIVIDGVSVGSDEGDEDMVGDAEGSSVGRRL